MTTHEPTPAERQKIEEVLVQLEIPLCDDLGALKTQMDELRGELGEEQYEKTLQTLREAKELYVSGEEESKEGNEIDVEEEETSKQGSWKEEKGYCSEWPSTKKKAKIAEERVLRSVLGPHLKTHYPQEQKGYQKIAVEVEEGKCFLGRPKTLKINTIVLGKWPNTDAEKGKTIVLCHGYGGGVGFWFRNIPFFYDLVSGRHSDSVPKISNVFIIDWLGFGLSSRPSFPKECNTDRAVENAEGFFVSSLEKWRKKLGLERFVLVGHSLGAYMSTVYSLTYPASVEKLVLLSPAGLAARPSAPLTSVEKSTLFKIVKAAIDLNITPYSILRGVGPKGPSLIRRYVKNYALSEELSAPLASYLYQINAQKGSGEYALKAILLPGAYAIYGRKGLMDRIGQLAMPVSFYYGSHDWMNPDDAVNVMKILKVPARLEIIEQAGHNLFVNNPSDFETKFLKEFSQN